MSLEQLLLPLHALPQDHSQPRQQRLYQLLKEGILAGVLAPGQRLPASRALAAEHGLARNSVLYAYQQGVAEGFLVADRQGTRVAALPLAAPAAPQTAAGDGRNLFSRRAAGLQARRGEAVLPFAPGVPDLNAFPWSRWARYLQGAWGEVSARQLAYAAPGGEPLLRRAVADYLRARRGVACTPEQVFIVPGGQVALDACARLLADAGDTAWLENPGYPLARATMLAADLDVVPVAVDAAGMAPSDDLWRRQPPRLLYLTPSHQYPLGAVLSLERRLDFLHRVADSGGWIIEDDYDSEFNHARPRQGPLPAIQGLQAGAPVIYVGTFSKLLYPGLRLAYMVVPFWAAGQVGQAIESLYRSGQAVEQRALARFLDGGHLTAHQRRMAPVYRAREAALRQALHQRFGVGVAILGGAAGLHLTLMLPEGPADTAIVRRAAELGVAARALSEYCHPAGPIAANGLVLGYGMADAPRIPELVGRLAAAVEAAAGDGHG